MSSKTIPNLAAVIETKQARLKVITRPIPTPGDGEIVVRNYAIAGNPVDWKIQDYSIFVEKYPSVLGSDVAGIVTAVGPKVSHFALGDRVTGFSGVIHNSNIDHGAWQTYTVLPEVSTSKIPDSMTYEQASVFPMGMATAMMALFHELKIPRVPLTTGPETNEVLLIWGAASSVGSSAVQTAHAFGWKVFATASAKHHSWISKLGADRLFDYHDADVVDQISQATKEAGYTMRRAFDPISEGVTLNIVPEALKAAGGVGGTIATVLWWPEGKKYPEDVTIALTVAMRHAQDLHELGRWFFNGWLEKAMQDGVAVPAPAIEVVDGGVGAAQRVLDQLKQGVSGKKLVVHVD